MSLRPHLSKDDGLILSNDIVVNTSLEITPSLSGNFLTISPSDTIPILHPRAEKENSIKRLSSEEKISRSYEEKIFTKESQSTNWYGIETFNTELRNGENTNNFNSMKTSADTLSLNPPPASSNRGHPLENLTSESVASQMDFLKKQLLNEIRKRKILETKLSKKEQTIEKLKERLSTNPSSSKSTKPRSESSPALPLIENFDSEKDELIAILQAQIAKKDKKIEQLESECKKASLISWRTMNDKLKQEVEVEVWRRKFQVLQSDSSQIQSALDQKVEEITQLRTQLKDKEESNYKMALKLMDYQTKVSNVELQLRKFTVKKIYKLYPNVEVEVVLTKSPANGIISLDVVERGRHSQKPLKSVQMVQGVPNRFSATYTDSSVDNFESEMSEDIVESINDVILV